MNNCSCCSYKPPFVRAIDPSNNAPVYIRPQDILSMREKDNTYNASVLVQKADSTTGKAYSEIQDYTLDKGIVDDKFDMIS